MVVVVPAGVLEERPPESGRLGGDAGRVTLAGQGASEKVRGTQFSAGEFLATTEA